MKKLSLLLATLSVALMVTVVFADKKEKKDPLAGVKCLVNGKKAAKAACSTEYKGKKVYFCCGNCLKAFKADNAKFAAKANHQLHATKQAKLVKCVFSGRKLNGETVIEIAGNKVCFCCANCQKKAQGADDKITCVYNDKAFAKGFEIVK